MYTWECSKASVCIILRTKSMDEESHNPCLTIPSIWNPFSETWSLKLDSECSYKPGYSCVLYLETMRKRVRCQKGCQRGNVNVNVNWNHVKHNCCGVNSVQLLRHNIRWNRLLVVEDTQKECKTSSRSWSLDSVCNFGHRGWFSWFKFNLSKD